MVFDLFFYCVTVKTIYSYLLIVHVLKFAKFISLSFFFKHVRVSLSAVKDLIFSFDKVNIRESPSHSLVMECI